MSSWIFYVLNNVVRVDQKLKMSRALRWGPSMKTMSKEELGDEEESRCVDLESDSQDADNILAGWTGLSFFLPLIAIALILTLAAWAQRRQRCIRSDSTLLVHAHAPLYLNLFPQFLLKQFRLHRCCKLNARGTNVRRLRLHRCCKLNARGTNVRRLRLHRFVLLRMV